MNIKMKAFAGAACLLAGNALAQASVTVQGLVDVAAG